MFRVSKSLLSGKERVEENDEGEYRIAGSPGKFVVNGFRSVNFLHNFSKRMTIDNMVAGSAELNKPRNLCVLPER